ncbi:DUF4303 domain-containing protein [Paenibacillus sp. 1001270B_150601_E10]|uniref:DUF4303 domain-containing protein n=1 Tax=Paenibacillus sp. 1001270B_150601_E10 TaxID=2787079 RepID=UPI0018A0E8A4|nr:DUF4303 domain-containing protein [Paenibacillus sp. 1001270B_150601_E10]
MEIAILKQELKEACKYAFVDIVEEHKYEGINSFALSYDQRTMKLFPSVNTMHYLNQALALHGDHFWHFKYDPTYWKYVGTGACEAFESIYNKLRSYAATVQALHQSNEKLHNWKRTLYDTCTAALEDLVQSRFFLNVAQRNILVLYTAADCIGVKCHYLHMMKRLNTDTILKEYEQELQK